MSSTNRGGQRSEADFYSTPEWCVTALLKAWQPPFTGGWCEPCVGDGAIVNAVNKYYNNPQMPEWTTIDIRPECNAQITGDFLQHYPDTSMCAAYNVIITNPPYSLAQEFIEHSLQLSSWVAMLLRLNFASGQKRAPFHREHPSGIYVLPKRPSFTGKGTDSCEYAWFVWGSPRIAGRWQVLDPNET